MSGRKPHVNVIGAGLVGASIACSLARRGLAVTILERGAPGGVATPRSFAWINASWGNPARYTRFRMRSIAAWHALGRAMPALGVDFCGGLLWDLPPEGLEDYVRAQGALGYDVRLVDRAEALRLEPGLREAPELAAHAAGEGAVEPEHAAHIMVEEAVRLGARLRTGAQIVTLETRGDRVIGAVDSAGHRHNADETVVAAGTQTATLLASAGILLALTDPPGLIAHTTILDRRLLRGLLMAPGCHVRQTAAGRLIIGADFTGGSPTDQPDEAARHLVEKARSLIDGAEAAELAYTTVGHRPTPADGFPAIGRHGATEGLVIAVMHSGVTLAPLVGDLVAELIAAGRADDDLADYRPDRPALSSSAA